MLKRTLYFGNPYHIYVQNGQLHLADKKTGEIKQAPIEDIGICVFDNHSLTFTQSVIQELVENNVAVVFCGKKHHPQALLQPLAGGYIQSKVFNCQVQSTKPLSKQLWQQTVKSKISNQAGLLDQVGKNSEPLRHHIRQVASNDITNREAQAARYYWQHLFDIPQFRRERHGDPPNNCLNYGYAILRAAVARALVGSSLTPQLGFHHHNQYNAFCLADDVMEPYRPFVDRAVVEIIQQHSNPDDLTTEIKARLLKTMSDDIIIENQRSPLMIGLSKTTASLAKIYLGEGKEITYPTLS
jgi:CRISPR-associated protein Cas1